jgi:uncharacterized protein
MDDPLIYDFQTKSGNFYVYDVCTNQTYPVTQLDIYIIKNYRKMNLDKLINYFNSYSKNQIEKSYQKIYTWVKKLNMFFPQWDENNVGKIPSKQRYFRDLANLDQIILETTQKCNLRCRYCIYSNNYNFFRKHSLKKMTWEIAKRSIDYFIGNVNSPWRTSTFPANIGFYGGEPLLEFELIKRCVTYCKQQDCNVDITHNMTTNGTLISEEMIYFLLENEIDLLISLDGPQSEHDKHRIYPSGKGSYQKVDSTLQLIWNIDKTYYEKHVHFNAVFTPLTDLVAVIKYFSQNTPKISKKISKLIQMGPPEGRFFESISTTSKVECENQMKILFQKYEKLQIEGNNNNNLFWVLDKMFGQTISNFRDRNYIIPQHKIFNAATCIPGLRRIFVDADGLFHTCEKITSSFPIGDCQNGIKYEQVKKHFINFIKIINDFDNCLECIAVHNCSICMAIISRDGIFKKPDCKGVRDRFKQLLAQYYTIIEENPNVFAK